MDPDYTLVIFCGDSDNVLVYRAADHLSGVMVGVIA
jgi:hypothetical protein